MEDWRCGAGTENGASALVEASKRAFRRWDTRLTLAAWRAIAARVTGPSACVVQNRGPAGTGLPRPQRGGCSRPRLSSAPTCSASENSRSYFSRKQSEGYWSVIKLFLELMNSRKRTGKDMCGPPNPVPCSCLPSPGLYDPKSSQISFLHRECPSSAKAIWSRRSWP